MADAFLSREPKLEDYWRGIILFGRNVASYKFALAKSLLEVNPQSGQLVALEELALPFSKAVAAHLKLADKQSTASTSKFLDACRNFNSGSLGNDELVQQTVRLGFNNVIDAFHIVGRGEIPQRFFTDERVSSKGIRITDEFSKLAEGDQIGNLEAEVEAPWRLVETAWSQGVSRNLLSIDYDEPSAQLLATDRLNRRTVVTSSRDALNGYQKGKCFYCFRNINLHDDALKPDVDHFFPHTLKQLGFGTLVDGVWNLALSCRECNRGPRGKFDSVPSIHLLSRLHKRNEFLILSHHPLRETLMQQTGITESERRAHLQKWHDHARAALIHQWEPVQVAEAVFEAPEYIGQKAILLVRLRDMEACGSTTRVSVLSP